MSFDISEVYVRKDVCIQLYDVVSNAEMDCIFFVETKDKDRTLQVLEETRKEALRYPRKRYGEFLVREVSREGIEHEVYFKRSTVDRSLHESPGKPKKEGVSIRETACIQVYSMLNEDMDCIFFVSAEDQDAALLVLEKAWDDFWEQQWEPYGDYLTGEMQKAGISYEVYYKDTPAGWCMYETVGSPKEEEPEAAMPMVSDQTEPCKSLMRHSMAEIERLVLTYVQGRLDSMGKSDEVLLHGARVYGSRRREGLYTADSDVDVVVSYTGNISEDSLFNRLNEKKMAISGMLVDINPISTEKTGTLKDFMERAEEYLDEKAKLMANPQQEKVTQEKQQICTRRTTRMKR